MEKHTLPTLFELLLKITGLLLPEDLKILQPWLSLLKEALWVSGSRSLCLVQEGNGVALHGLIFDLSSRLGGQGTFNTDRLFVFIIANWEVVEVGMIEGIFELLGQCHPEAKIEAMCLHSEGSQAIELILARN